MAVDLRKRHPYRKEIKQAISICWFGMLVIIAGAGEMIYFHDYQAASTMFVAAAMMICSLRVLHLTLSAWPMKPVDVWLMRRARRLHSLTTREDRGA